ncbi:MAG TPA: GNAT family N-acetyltransferase [Candidatus Bathyarchaeia archaeon]|nr:GNAT family N-acetyltransferase [Candidatus Bathyarchaeia archaeon]
MKFTARTAMDEDYRSIVGLCRRAIGPRDYVISILKYLIADGGLLLAFHERELVGITNFEKCIDRSAWLGQARTDPSWRRKGVAVFLQRAVSTEARKRGLKTVRMWVRGGNLPAIGAGEKGGYTPVCELVHLRKRIRSLRGPITRPMKSIDRTFAISTLWSSPILQASNGYLAHSWHIIRPNPSSLMTIAGRGEFYSGKDGLFIFSQSEKWSRRFYPSLSVLRGPIRDVLKAVAGIPHVGKSRTLGTYAPNDPFIVRNLIRNGFKIDDWGDRCIVYEKRLASN